MPESPSPGGDCIQSSFPTGPGQKATLATRLGHAGGSALATASQICAPPVRPGCTQNASSLPSPLGAFQGATVRLGFARGDNPQGPRPSVRSVTRAGPAGPRAHPGALATEPPRAGLLSGRCPPPTGLKESQSNLLPPPSLLPPPRPPFALHTPICTLRKPTHEPHLGPST